MQGAKSGDEFEVELLLTTMAAGKELGDAEPGWLDSHGGVLSNGDNSGPSPAQSQNTIGSLFFSCWNNFLIISSSPCSYFLLRLGA